MYCAAELRFCNFLLLVKLATGALVDQLYTYSMQYLINLVMHAVIVLLIVLTVLLEYHYPK